MSRSSNLPARFRIACLLAILFFCVRYARAQAPSLQSTVSPPASALASAGKYKPVGEEAGVKVNFPNVPIQAIIPFYEDLTGKKLILDSNLQGNQLRIMSQQLLTKREAIAFVESSLLLNGYVFIHVDATTAKLINHSSGGNVANKGLEVFNSIADLPTNEVICHFVLPLQYISATDAAKAFQEAIKPNTYGSLMPVANDSALLITENSVTIRSICRIAQIIDVPPTQIANETIKLVRANVEIVAKIINQIFEQDEKSQTASSAPAPTAVPTAAGAPGQPRVATAPTIGTGVNSTSSTNPASGKVKVIPYLRTNELIVFARPVDIAYIRALAEKLDKQDDGDTFKKFRLNYLKVVDFLPSVRDALGRDTDIESESGGASSGGGRREGSRSRQGLSSASRNQSSGNNNNLFNNGNNSINGGAGMSNGGGFNGGPRTQLEAPDDIGAPESIIVGRTFLLADPQSNSLIVNGSPEHIQRIEQLLRELDIQPQQIYISAIIGQLNLGTEFNYGFDFLRLLDDFSVRDVAAGAAGAVGAVGAVGGAIQLPLNLQGFSSSKFNFYGQLGPMSNYIKLIEGNRNFKVLATPSIFAKNAARSVISSGQKIAVPAQILSNGAFAGGVANSSVSVEYRDVVLELAVIPLINSDNEVTLQIAQVNDNIVGTQTIGNNTVPTIGTQKLETEVSVKDGATVVLGGLITERINDSGRGGIFLRRIPILKHLFGTTTKSSTREELLIFIQPHIIRNGDPEGPNRIERGRSNLYEEALQFSSPELRDIPRAALYDGK